jgi:hypothetical protein
MQSDEIKGSPVHAGRLAVLTHRQESLLHGIRAYSLEER